MDPTTCQLIESLHRSACKYVVALTGGGTTAAAGLLSVPGGSRSILEVVVPYHENALADFLGFPPEQYCSEATAVLMASRAYERASWLAAGEVVAGVGCTASLATDRPKKGEHRFHLAIRTAQQTATYSLVLSKGARDRQGEEGILTAVLLNALAETFGIAERVPVALVADERVQTSVEPGTDLLAAFLRGEQQRLCAEIDGRLSPISPHPAVLLPGSFNPLHEGHWRLALAAAQITGKPVAFELSVTNVDKPPLSAEEVRLRLRHFLWRAPIWLSRAPTFVEKAALFPGVVFVVGADTAVRIVDPRYYRNSAEQMTAALGKVQSLGCRFLVAGRLEAAGKFVGLEQITIPAGAADLFSGIPESVFRFDISSTQIRGQSSS